MFSDFFLNACILIAFISITHLYFKNREINNNFSVKFKIITGVSCGLLVIILMIYRLNVTSDIIIDFQYMPILLAALIAALII